MTIHLRHAKDGPPRCGFSSTVPVDASEDVGRVDCVACLRAEVRLNERILSRTLRPSEIPLVDKSAPPYEPPRARRLRPSEIPLELRAALLQARVARARLLASAMETENGRRMLGGQAPAYGETSILGIIDGEHLDRESVRRLVAGAELHVAGKTEGWTRCGLDRHAWGARGDEVATVIDLREAERIGVTCPDCLDGPEATS